jgi:hypothetical protein
LGRAYGQPTIAIFSRQGRPRRYMLTAQAVIAGIDALFNQGGHGAT